VSKGKGSSKKGGAGGKGGKAVSRKTTPVKVVHILRVRCKEDHDDPWLGELGVVWTPLPPKPANANSGQGQGDGGQAAATPATSAPADATQTQRPAPAPAPAAKKDIPKYYAGVTDEDGYLSQPATEEKEGKAIPAFVAGTHYRVFLVRHPDPEVRGMILRELSRGSAKYGDGLDLVPELEETGKANGKPVKELVLLVPEDPKSFLPQGSDQYQGWVLYKGMPNAACAPVRAEVVKLQRQFASMRFIIGGVFSPYTPATPESPKKLRSPLWMEGNFSTYAWNSCLVLQKCGVNGIAFDTNLGEEVEVAKAKLKVDGVVDKATGDLVAEWIKSGYRKPGKILMAIDNRDTYWMREDAAQIFKAWEDSAHAWGMSQKLATYGGYRQPEADVGGAGFGKAQLSIHKTGMAVDLASEGFATYLEGLPIRIVREDQPDHRVCWRMYILAKRKDPVPDASKEKKYYKDSIEPWQYLNDHPDGGFQMEPHVAPEGKVYLDLTALALDAGFSRIMSFKEHWFDTLPERVRLGTYEAFDQFMRRLALHGKFAKVGKGKGAPHAAIYQEDAEASEEDLPAGVLAGVGYKRVAGSDEDLPSNASTEGETELAWDSLKEDIGLLEFWYKLTYKQKPTPSLAIDPSNKKDASLLRTLKKAGRKRRFVIEQGEDSEEIELGPKTTFPKKPFTLSPNPQILSVAAGQVYRFPEILGEPIGLEWWHYEVPKKVRGKSWLELMEEIGWTRDGLLGDTPESEEKYYGRGGIGYDAKTIGGEEE
jgi:hypothetical protein